MEMNRHRPNPPQLSIAPAALKNLLTGECHYLHEVENIIGRNENAFICIKEKQVSRKHCSITKNEDGSFSIRDLSAHGTLLNGQKLMANEVRVLCDRDKVAIAGPIGYSSVFEFVVNRHYEFVKQRSEAVSSRFKEQIIDLDTSYTEDMRKLSDMITGFEVEKGVIKEELNSRLEAQESMFQAKRLGLTNLVTTSNEQKLEAERKLKEVEDKSKLEKEKLMQEIDEKINDITMKEKELEETKLSMEQRYQTERFELEERCKAEIEELKGKLAESEVEQGRLKGETLVVEKKLEETRQNLHESELEQFRLHQEKVAVEKKLESKIEESSTKDGIVKFLEQRLIEKEKAEEKIKKEMEDLEEELLCSICSELYIQPCVLNCGHLYCKSCIDEWKKKKKVCPMCRAKITSCVRMPKMDVIIDKNVSLLSNEAKERRKCTVHERSNESGVPAKKRKHHTPHNLYQPQINYQNETSYMGLDNVPRSAFPSTSHGTNAANHMLQIPVSLENTVPLDLSEPDPFAWAARNSFRQRDNLVSLGRNSPVTVAAVDLTDLTNTPRRHPFFNIPGSRTHTRTSTVSAADTTIDLTSL